MCPTCGDEALNGHVCGDNEGRREMNGTQTRWRHIWPKPDSSGWYYSKPPTDATTGSKKRHQIQTRPVGEWEDAP